MATVGQFICERKSGLDSGRENMVSSTFVLSPPDISKHALKILFDKKCLISAITFFPFFFETGEEVHYVSYNGSLWFPFEHCLRVGQKCSEL